MSACRSPWCWKIQSEKQTVGSDILSTSNLFTIFMRLYVMWTLENIRLYHIVEVYILHAIIDYTKRKYFSTQPRAYSYQENPLYNSHAKTISLILPGGQQEMLSNHMGLWPRRRLVCVHEAAAQKELTQNDQSCRNITEAQRFDHAPTSGLNS